MAIARAIAATVRFVCHIPLGMWSNSGSADLYFFREHADVLLKPPLGETILAGERIAGRMGTAAFFWNFFMWLPMFACPEKLLFFVGIVDAAITVSIIVASAIQAGYYGMTEGECERIPPPLDAVVTDRKLMLLQRLQSIEPDKPLYAETVCKGLQFKYYMGVAIVILYGIMSTSSIGFGAAAWYEDRVRSRRWARLPEPSVRDVISEIVLLPLHALSGALSGVAMLLPHSAKQKLTSVWHSTNQRTIDISISAATVATSLYQKLHKTMSSWYIQTVPFKDTNSPKTPLIKALGTPLILINIAQHLHHTDAVNLALASKAVHKALQPPTTTSTPGSRFLTSPGPGTLDSEPEPKTEEEEHLLPKATPQAEKQLLPSASSSPSASEYLRSLTCTGTKKLECWGCGLQICKTCSAKSWTRNPPISHHITLCSPRCASCAQTQIRNHGHGPCICSVTDGRNADRAREIFLADLYEDRTVCSKCGFCLLNREVMDRRAEYGREIYRREMLVRGVVCGGCGVALDLKSRGLGEVWWVCAGGEDGKGCGSVCEGCECECLILGDRKGGMEKKEREEGVSYVGDGWSWSWPGL